MTIRPVRQRQRPSNLPPPNPSPEPPDAALEAPPAATSADNLEPPLYKVGYRKPPVHTRFKPGQSGNPRGRPKQARGLKTLSREILTQKVAVRTANGEKKIAKIEVVLQKTIELAMKGNARALGEVMKLYAAAVPDTSVDAAETAPEDLTATDLAMLEALKLQILAQDRDSE
jgi:hypothetical protein